MSKKDFKEFVDFVAKQFSAVIARIEHLEKTKADKEDVRRIVNEVTDKQTDKIFKLIDGYAKKSDDQKLEHNILVGQVNRHDRWINKIALKTDTKLDY